MTRFGLPFDRSGASSPTGRTGRTDPASPPPPPAPPEVRRGRTLRAGAPVTTSTISRCTRGVTSSRSPELTGDIRSLLEEQFFEVWVQGELSNSPVVEHRASASR